jgi:hypothetical protein
VYGSCFLIRMHTRCSFVGSITKLHYARYMTPDKHTRKISTFTELHETLYTDSKICYYYPLLSHPATTTAVQIEAPLPEIVDITSYTLNSW